MVVDGNRKAVKFPPHCRILRDHGVIAEEGWKEALISGGDHLKRVLEEYGELGFECLLEELESPGVGGCSECFKAAGERIYRVYVRLKSCTGVGNAGGEER
jgi:hypothetical protein